MSYLIELNRALQLAGLPQINEEQLLEKVKMKTRDAWGHLEKMKELMAKGQATQKMVDGALKRAEELESSEMKARESAFYERAAGSDWWELAKKQYPIKDIDGGFRVDSEAKEWKNDKQWEFTHKVQALEKVEKLVKWLHQSRKKGIGDKEIDLEKFYKKYNSENKDN